MSSTKILGIFLILLLALNTQKRKINMVINQPLQFSQVIPQLAALYRQGLLVPFLGSGMSINVCGSWDHLLTKLATETGIRESSFIIQPDTSDIEKMQLANEAVDAMRAYSLEKQIRIYRKGLSPDVPDLVVPDKTKALAKHCWPLVIQTNYDDVYWKAVSDKVNGMDDQKSPATAYSKPVTKAKLAFSIPLILGRSLEDCHKILRSLDEVHPPYIWTIQGFIGGQLAEVKNVVKDPEKRKQLASQIVIGHQHYQRTINADNHFRRAFSDVYRRRSLLFLGSGILESYFINLFSEILHHQGSGPYPHFALISENQKNNYDVLFMQRRLGIVPIFYKNEDKTHQEITRYINIFNSNISFRIKDNKTDRDNQSLPTSPIIINDKLGYILSGRDQHENLIKVSFNVIKSPMSAPRPDQNECSVVSVGRDITNRPKIGQAARSYFTEAVGETLENVKNKERWKPLDVAPSYIYRYIDSNSYAIAARSRHMSKHEHDIRDLNVISEAVCNTLQTLDKEGYSTINLGTIASGKTAPWHSIYPFAETLRGIQKFLSKPVHNIRRINFHIVNTETWYPIISGKIPILSLLTSPVSTYIIEIRTLDPNITPERFSFTSSNSLKVKELLTQCNTDSKLWNINVEPYPLSDLQRKHINVLDMTISAAMRVVLTPRENGER